MDSRAKTTVSKYAYGFKRFMNWAQKYPEIDSILPASDLYVSLYLQYLLQTVKHFSSVESAFYSIKWAHKLANLPDPCDSDLVRSVVEAAKRNLNKPVQKKEPIDAKSIKALFHKYTIPRTLKDLRLLSICTVSYTGFLRYNELCSIKANHLSFKSNHLEIFIPSSKTDCYRKGNSLVIAKTFTQYCPVSILLQYVQEANIDLNSDMYIFRSMSYVKKSNNFKLRRTNVKLSYTRAREIVKTALSSIGLNRKLFGLHSFRSGGATAAASYGVSDRLFKAHGRWKTENAKDGYVAEDLEKRLSVTKHLGL